MRSTFPTTVLCLAFLLDALPVSAQTFLFDFGAAATTTERAAAPDDPINYWNNVVESVGTSTNGMLTNIVTAVNGSSTMGLAIISRFNGSNPNGTTASTIFAADATRDSLFGNTEIFNGLTNIFPIFKLTGLDPATAYDFTFYASRTGVSDNRETVYTIAGANNGSGVLNAVNNVDNVATVNAILPTAAGEITISLAPTANNNNAFHFTYLGVMKIVAIPPQTPIGFTLEPVNVRAVALSEVTFQAAVTGATPHFAQWFSNDVPIPGANQLTYTIPSVTLDMDGSRFSVNVSNLVYGITSSNATLRVVDDIIPPELVSVSTLDGLTVNVCFNEALNQASAEEEFYFYVNTDLFPILAVLDTNQRCVTLTFDQKISGTFTLWVEYLTDLSGNPIALTNLTAQVPDPESQMVLIDFGGGNFTTQLGAAPADDPVRTWNNVLPAIGQSDLGVLAQLVTTQNVATAIGLQMIRRFNGFNENGSVAANVPFPTDATRDSMFGNIEIFSGLTNIFPSFKLTGLNPARIYDLTFYASRTGVTDNRETQYSIEGASSNVVFLNVANNVTDTVTASVAPSAAGELAISLWPGPNNNNGNHFTYLGVLAITPQGEPTAPKFLTPTVSGGSIYLQWTGTGFLQSAPAVVGPWTTITPTAPNAHQEPIDLGTNRFFRIEQ